MNTQRLLDVMDAVRDCGHSLTNVEILTNLGIDLDAEGSLLQGWVFVDGGIRPQAPVAWLYTGPSGHTQAFTSKPPPSMLREPNCKPLYLHAALHAKSEGQPAPAVTKASGSDEQE
jgi:hypothetical protein